MRLDLLHRGEGRARRDAFGSSVCVEAESDSRLGKFDIVFCRNVLIYFDQATKGQVLSRIAQIMPADGYLYLGGAETVLGISDSFEVVPGQRGIYRLTNGNANLDRKVG